MSGKGSSPRPFSVSQEEYANNFDRIFGKKNMTPQVKENVEEVGKCGCGRSPTGKCIGWHALSESAFQAKLAEYIAEKEAE
jgi:hypothetical protein